MNIANPIWLWGLSALLIPLAIHLWSRQKTRLMPFGSVRFLKETSSSRSNRIQLSDVLLMLLRMILLILVILLLAGLIFPEKVKKQNWLLLGEKTELPKAYENEQFEVHRVKDLKKGRKYLNQWFFMKELSQEHPEIDSLIWIDSFENSDFWGAVPAFNYSYELIDKNNVSSKEASRETRADTAYYLLQALEDSHTELIDNILKTNTLYTDSALIFAKTADQQQANVYFGTTAHQNIPLQFIFSRDLSQLFTTENQWPEKCIHISVNYLTDKLLYNQLLLLITEQLAQWKQPLWKYNSFEAATRFRRDRIQNEKALDKNQSKNISKMQDWLFWLILPLFVLERFWVYRRANA